jgi:CBS domain-containing protein
VPDPPPPDQLVSASFPHVHLDHTLDAAMRRMAQSSLEVLPVVSRTNVRELKGVLSLNDILAAYRMGERSDGQEIADEG